MSQVAVEKVQDAAALPRTLWDEMNSITQAIRERAFDLFQRRGSTDGWDLGDWLQAEHDVVWSPPTELIEDKGDFQARIAIPGFEAKEIQVSATPDALIVEAEQSHTHEGKEGTVRFCEFSGKKLFRRVELPSAVDVDKVTASLDKGILLVSAPKAKQPKQIAVAA